MKQIGRGSSQQLPRTMGPVDRVPCPHCAHTNTFVHLDSQRILDTGHRISCDKCRKMMEVTNIRDVRLVQVRPLSGSGAAAASSGGSRQATTISHAALQRLIGGR